DKPAPKKYTMRFKDAPWDRVLTWFADTSGLTPIYTVKPTGTFTFEPRNRDQEFTLTEITDILNEPLEPQKLILLRRQVAFTVVPADEKLDGSPRRYEVADLERLPKQYLITLLFPLKHLDAKEAAAEVEKMITPSGTVSVIEKTNTLVVYDTVGNL